MMPQVASVTAKGYEVLCLTEDIDEFAVGMLNTYAEKQFLNVCKDELDLSTDEEKAELKDVNDKSGDLFAAMKETLGDSVADVRFTNKLGDAAVCLSDEGELSSGMVNVLNRMPGADARGLKAQVALEINKDHPVAGKLASLYASDRDQLAKYTRLLYGQARLLAGLNVEDPVAFSALISELMTK